MKNLLFAVAVSLFSYAGAVQAQTLSISFQKNDSVFLEKDVSAGPGMSVELSDMQKIMHARGCDLSLTALGVMTVGYTAEVQAIEAPGGAKKLAVLFKFTEYAGKQPDPDIIPRCKQQMEVPKLRWVEHSTTVNAEPGETVEWTKVIGPDTYKLTLRTK